MEDRYLTLSDDYEKMMVAYRVSADIIGEKVYTPAKRVCFLITSAGHLFILRQGIDGKDRSILDAFAPGIWLSVSGTSFKV